MTTPTSSTSSYTESERYREFLKKPVCKYVRLARDRHLRDLEQSRTDPEYPYYYDETAADRVVKFISYLRLNDGEWYGKPFTLEDFQEFDIVRPLFGWRRKVDGLRRFKEAHVEIAKKNGKSTLCSAIALYLLVGDQERGAQVYCAATARHQAKLVFDAARKMAEASRQLSRHLDIFKNNISFPGFGAKCEPLTGDADTQDGFSPSGVINDELHRWSAKSGRDLYDMIKQSTAARRQPLIFNITTAGVYDKLSLCWIRRNIAIQMLENRVPNDTLFAFIATLDEDDDPFDESVWIKANPCLGVSVKLQSLREMAEEARKNPSELNAFLRYRMNKWTQQVTRWLPMDAWDACKDDIDPESLVGEACYAGLDLSSSLDLTALVLVFPRPDGKVHVLPWFFHPEQNMLARELSDGVPYFRWKEQGHLIATAGNTIDGDFIVKKVEELGQKYMIQEVAFDPYNAIDIVNRIKNLGFETVAVRQGYLSLNAASKRLEEIVVSGRMQHSGNPLLSWCASNVAVSMDAAKNIKPDKDKSTARIDGIAALVNALTRLVCKEDTPDPYASRGLLSI